MTLNRSSNLRNVKVVFTRVSTLRRYILLSAAKPWIAFVEICSLHDLLEAFDC